MIEKKSRKHLSSRYKVTENNVPFNIFDKTGGELDTSINRIVLYYVMLTF